jgi:hypothetical protein
MLEVRCSCGLSHRLPAELGGKRIRCKCGQIHQVPGGGPALRPEFEVVPSGIEGAVRWLSGTARRLGRMLGALRGALPRPSSASWLFLVMGVLAGVVLGWGLRTTRSTVHLTKEGATAAPITDPVNSQPITFTDSTSRGAGDTSATRLPRPNASGTAPVPPAGRSWEPVLIDPFPPDNGHFIKRPHSNPGLGELKLVNGSSDDAVVKLVQHTGSVRATYCVVYVSSHDEVNLTDIPEGQFEVRFAMGREWSTAARRFNLPGLPTFVWLKGLA